MSPQEIDRIYNYLAISDAIGSAGQPKPEQFEAIGAAGYEVVVNLDMPDSSTALPNERDLVVAQGMIHVPIPVVWESPTARDLEEFFEVMARYRDSRVFVHCAANMRVSCFLFLYRVLRLGVSPQDAEEALHCIWKPNAIWQAFIDRSLAQPGGDSGQPRQQEPET